MKSYKEYDFDITKFFNWLFSMEIEYNSGLTRSFLNKLSYIVETSSETRDIHELNQLHRLNQEQRMEVFSFMKEHYKDKMPIWENRYSSWGNHFHLKFPYKDDTNTELNKILLNCPLFAKFTDKNMYTRKNDRYKFSFQTDIIDWSKSYAVSTWPLWLEFRCNNVIDERILWYYQAAIIMSENPRKWKMKWLNSSDISYLMKWDDYRFSESWDVELSRLYWKHFWCDRELLDVLEYNINIMLKVLRSAELFKSADKLEEYCIEYNLIPKKEEKC